MTFVVLVIERSLNKYDGSNPTAGCWDSHHYVYNMMAPTPQLAAGIAVIMCSRTQRWTLNKRHFI